MKWLKVLLGTILFFAIAGSAFAKPVEISHLLVDTKPQQWQLFFETSGPVRFHEFQLSNPNRVVIDLKNSRLVNEYPSFLLFGTPVARVRYSKRPGGTLRLVLDMQRPVFAMTSLQRPNGNHGYRLAVTLNTAMMRAAPTPAPKKIPQKPVMVSQPSHAAKRDKDIIVVIDPGHGGKDPGATGRRGTHEKNVVLAISRDLQRDIDRVPGFKAYLTRSSDYFITLRGRLAIARKYKADMFIAIHADAYRNRTAHGVSVFALSQRGATSEAARWIARQENASELMGGVELSDKSNTLKSVLLSLSQTATIHASLQIGQDILHYVRPFARLHHGSVEQAAFVVLKSPDIPSLLVETGFLSNSREEMLLRSPRYRHKIAAALTKGIRQYYIEHPPRGSWLAMRK